MKLHLSKKDFLAVAALTLFLAAVGGLLWVGFGTHGLAVAALVAFCVLLTGGVELHRRAVVRYDDTLNEIRTSYAQLEALALLQSTLQPKLPFPASRGFAASPDFLAQVVSVILTTSPRLVVELGSGLSTLVIGLALKKAGGGRLVSIEHDEDYYRETLAGLAAHGIDETIVEVRRAPLEKTAIGGESWSWYRVGELSDLEAIDLLVVDGPPSTTQPLARYPALPIFIDRLSESAQLVLDDGRRDEEKVIVERWQREFTGIQTRYLDLEAGAFIVTLQ